MEVWAGVKQQMRSILMSMDVWCQWMVQMTMDDVNEWHHWMVSLMVSLMV